MPPNRVKAGKKRTRATYAATPTPKRAKKTPKENPRPLTTDDIPVLVREVCKNLSPRQMEAQDRRGESRGDGRRRTRQTTGRDRNAHSQEDGEDDTHVEPPGRQNSTGSQDSTHSETHNDAGRQSSSRRRETEEKDETDDAQTGKLAY